MMPRTITVTRVPMQRMAEQAITGEHRQELFQSETLEGHATYEVEFIDMADQRQVYGLGIVPWGDRYAWEVWRGGWEALGTGPNLAQCQPGAELEYPDQALTAALSVILASG